MMDSDVDACLGPPEAAEEFLRFRAELLDALGQPVIATDRDGRIRYWNRAAEQLYGWTASEVLGRDILKVTPTEMSQAQASELMARLAAGESWTGEFTVGRKDGTSFPVMVTDTPVRDGAGQVVGVIGVSWDLSERKEAERLAREAYERSRQAVQERDRVLAFVSHDLRNPLHTITMASALLLESIPDEKKEVQIRVIRRAARQMARLIEDLLDLARIDGGGLGISPERTDGDEVIGAALELLQPLAESRGGELTAVVPAPLELFADRERIQQVLANLVSNAIDHTEPGGRIALGAEALPAGGALLSVVDTGRGIAADLLPLVFDRFWRAGRSTGAGLGLAIVKGIVEAHGGRVWAESEVAVGTAFFFTLPPAPGP